MTKPPRKPGLPAPALFAASVAIVIALVAGLGYVFAPATGVLATDIPKDAGPGFVFELEDGAAFSGFGELRIEAELVRYQRVNEDKQAVNSGARLREGTNRNRFVIEKRGLVDSHGVATPIYDHAKGKKVADTTQMFFPESFATYGKPVDDLFFLILYVTGVAFVLTEAFLLFCLFRYRANGGRSTYTHGNHKLEVFWTSGTAAFLLFLAIVQSKEWTEIKVAMPAADDPSTVVVQVVARQFEWNFRHAGTDKKFGTSDDVVSTGQLRVPVGKKVRLQFRSQDVIHSFFLPNFRLKQDVVPGLNTPGWFQAEREGEFPIMCAEFCGILHTSMGGRLFVLAQDEFDAWLAKESTVWAEENDGTPPSEWWGVAGRFWYWWDSNPLESATFTGRKAQKS